MKIKQLPEDFVVEEIPHLECFKEGKYSYFRLRKKNYEMHKALQKIADFLKIPVKNIGFAGTKDKHAVTTQFISIKNCPNHHESFSSEDIDLHFMGTGDKPISLGDLDGNKFAITVRDIDCEEKPEPIRQLINYFDEQRFSTNNAAIGKAIILGDFKKACELCDHAIVHETLGENPTDYLTAIKKLQFKLIKLFVNAYQSLLFNKITARYLQCKYGEREVISDAYSQGNFVFPLGEVEQIKIPLPGFGMDVKDGEIKRIMDQVLEEENLSEGDFIIRQFPEISAECIERNIVLEIDDLKIGELEEDELNKGKNKCLIKFALPKGSYATLIVKRLFSGK